MSYYKILYLPTAEYLRTSMGPIKGQTYGKTQTFLSQLGSKSDIIQFSSWYKENNIIFPCLVEHFEIIEVEEEK